MFIILIPIMSIESISFYELFLYVDLPVDLLENLTGRTLNHAFPVFVTDIINLFLLFWFDEDWNAASW